jgi:hypothetical protein
MSPRYFPQEFQITISNASIHIDQLQVTQNYGWSSNESRLAAGMPGIVKIGVSDPVYSRFMQGEVSGISG